MPSPRAALARRGGCCAAVLDLLQSPPLRCLVILLGLAVIYRRTRKRLVSTAKPAEGACWIG
jgi:hypothetical protein